jgi:hypothetical protein
MNALSNVVRVEEIQTIRQPVVNLVVVNVSELDRVNEKLEQLDSFVKGTNTQHVFWKKGIKLQRKTMHSVVISGHAPIGLAGINKIRKMKDYTQKLNAYQTLEAYIQVLRNKTMYLEHQGYIDRVTEKMLIEEKRMAQFSVETKTT